MGIEMPGRSLDYWDACIFIAWLKEEQRPDPRDLDGVAYLVEEWDARHLSIVTSTITRIEVLDSSLTSEQAALFQACLQRSTVRIESLTTPIADLAHELRQHYASPRLATPDAIHLATAIAVECNRMFTFDGANQTKPDKKCKLLPLGPKIAGKYDLPIELPRRPQKSQAEIPFPPPKR